VSNKIQRRFVKGRGGRREKEEEGKEKREKKSKVDVWDNQ
jgi:hypothetical protein